MISFRELNRADLPFLLSVRNSCRAMLHDNTEFTLQQAEDWFDLRQPRFYLVILGRSSIGYFRTSNWSEVHRNLYIGCDLHEDFRGKGYGRAAYQAFLRFLFEDRRMNKVSLEVLSHNNHAKKLYESLGFILEGVKREEVWRDGIYLDSLLFSMLSSEFNQRSASW
jgi:RimJ/RimL family protein N-acetyltransferase